MAIASVVLNILACPTSILGCGLIFPIISLFLGWISYVQAGKGENPRYVRILGLVGIILGGLLNVLLLVLLIVGLIRE